MSTIIGGNSKTRGARLRIEALPQACSAPGPVVLALTPEALSALMMRMLLFNYCIV